MNNKHSKFINGLSWSLAERLLTEVVNTIITILLARFLMPEDYGVVSLVQIFINISTIIVTCGLGPSIIQKKDIDDEDISTIFYLNFLLGVVLYSLLFVIAPLIANYYKKPELTNILRVLAIKIPISAIYDIQHSKIKKQLEFKKFFFSSLFGTVLAGMAGVYLAFNGYGVWALVVSNLIDQIVDCLFLFFSTKWIPSFSFNVKKCKSIIVFGRQLLFSEFISRTYSQVRSLVIGKKYSTADLAYNQKGQKYTNSVLELALSSIVRVFTPYLSTYQDDDIEMKKIVSKCIKISCFVAAPVMAGFIAIAKNMIPLLLTEKWNGCIPYVYIYCLRFILTSSCYLDRYIIQAKGEGKKLVELQTTEIVIELSLVVLSLLLFDNPLYLACTVFLDGIVIFYIYGKETKKLIDYGIKDHISDSIPSIALSSLMCVVVYFIGFININPLLILIIQMISGVIIYITISVFLKLEPAIYILDYILNLIKK